MGLSVELISQFAKMTADKKKTNTETTVYGEIVTDGNGNKYVRIDGSDQLTPVSSTTDAGTGDRVTVMVKNHTATVTGNLTYPSAKKNDVDKVSSKISEFEIVVADKVSTEELNAEIARINSLAADNVVIKEKLVATEAEIDDLVADNVIINEQLTVHKAVIDELDATYAKIDIIDATYAKMEDLETTNLQVHNLEADYADFESATITRLDAVDVSITNLETDKLDANFANIDFANIDKAVFDEFYATSGLIENVTTENGTVTGYLVGVTIKGYLIEGGTVVADKLVIKGEDGLYYKLNTEGITEDSYTNKYVKTDSTIDAVEGVLVDGAGTTTGEQVYSYTDSDGNTAYYCIDESLETPVYYSVELEANALKVEQTDYNSLNGSIITAKSITATKISVSDLVAFGATIGGFHITNTSIYSGVKETIDNSTQGVYLDNEGQLSFGDETNYIRYYKTVDSEGNEVYKLEISADSILFGDNSKSSMSDLKALTEHVKIGTYTDPETGDIQPSVELSEGDTDFKQVITNQKTMFMDGSKIGTSIDSDGVMTENVTIEKELRHGDYVWSGRTNGNYGLVWKGVTS